MILRLLSALLTAVTVMSGLAGVALLWGGGSTDTAGRLTAVFVLALALLIVVDRRLARRGGGW